MGKKKYSTFSSKCCDSSSSSSSSSDCFTSSSSYPKCCYKYPKCKCSYKNTCVPTYYPNNCVGNYPQCPPPCPPSNNYPCNPCPPYPCPPYPCNPSTYCGTPYTSSGAINTSATSTLSASSPNVNIFNGTNTVVTLPAISSLGCCKYTKMFIISNINETSLTINAGVSINGQDGFATTPINISFTLVPDSSVTLYAVYIPGGQSLWVIA